MSSKRNQAEEEEADLCSHTLSVIILSMTAHTEFSAAKSGEHISEKIFSDINWILQLTICPSWLPKLPTYFGDAMTG